jgi:hypothetical protein
MIDCSVFARKQRRLQCFPRNWLTHLLTYLLTYLLTHSMQHSPSWEANRFSASQEITHILWNPKVITAFKIARHLSLTWANSNQSITPCHTSWRSNLILPSHLRLGLPSGLFPSGFPTKTLYRLLLSPYVLHAPPFSWFDHRRILGEQYRSIISSLCSFPHSPVTSSL